jgi:hypothetical protein
MLKENRHTSSIFCTTLYVLPAGFLGIAGKPADGLLHKAAESDTIIIKMAPYEKHKKENINKEI